jgi:intergrase/recombinase
MSQLAEIQNEKKAAPSTSPRNEASSSEIQALSASISSLISKSKSYKRQLSLYNRNKKKFTDYVSKLNLPSTSEETGESAPKRDSKKTLVINFYRLLRSICISTNIIELENSDEDKQVIPPKFTDEIDSIFEEDKS